MLELYSAATPNGWKATVLLEELQLPYTLTPIDLGSNAQKEARIAILETWIFELTDDKCPRDYKQVIRTELLKTN